MPHETVPADIAAAVEIEDAASAMAIAAYQLSRSIDPVTNLRALTDCCEARARFREILCAFTGVSSAELKAALEMQASRAA